MHPWPPRSTIPASQNGEAVPRRARIQGSQTLVSLNSRLESNQEEEDWQPRPPVVDAPTGVERLWENLADFNKKLFKDLYQNRLDGQITGHVLVQIFLNS